MSSREVNRDLICCKHPIAQWRITYCSYVTGPEANGAEGPCGDEARRSAEEPEAPSKAPSTYELLCAVPFRFYSNRLANVRFRPGEEIRNCRARVRAMLDWRRP